MRNMGELLNTNGLTTLMAQGGGHVCLPARNVESCVLVVQGVDMCGLPRGAQKAEISA